MIPTNSSTVLAVSGGSPKGGLGLQYPACDNQISQEITNKESGKNTREFNREISQSDLGSLAGQQ